MQSPIGSNGEWAAERLRKTRAERELLELELGKERQMLIRAETVASLWEGTFIAIRERILGSHLSRRTFCGNWSPYRTNRCTSRGVRHSGKNLRRGVWLIEVNFQTLTAALRTFVMPISEVSG